MKIITIIVKQNSKVASVTGEPKNPTPINLCVLGYTIRTKSCSKAENNMKPLKVLSFIYTYQASPNLKIGIFAYLAIEIVPNNKYRFVIYTEASFFCKILDFIMKPCKLFVNIKKSYEKCTFKLK